MPVISFTPDDLLRGTLVEPAWYRIKIKDVTEKPSRDGGSTNYVVEGTIINEADTGDKKFENVPITWNFNSKAIGLAAGFIASITGGAPEANQRYELNSAVGKELEVFVENDTYDNRVINRVNHKYRPLRS